MVALSIKARICIYTHIFIVLLVIGSGCTKNVTGANPLSSLPSSNGVERLFKANEAQLNQVISNCFPDGKYRGMVLDPATNRAYLAKGWAPSNGFALFPLTGPITNIPLEGGNSAPYRPVFYISLLPQNHDETRVKVQTILATIVDGQEMGIHGGWANHQREITPVRNEEQNVLDAITAESKTEGYPLSETNR